MSRRRKKKPLPPLPNPMVALAAKQALDKMLAEHTPPEVTMNRSLLGGLLASVAARLGEPIKVEIDGGESITMTPADFQAMAVMSLGDFVMDTVKTMDPKKMRRFGTGGAKLYQQEVDAAAIGSLIADGPAAGYVARAVETHKKKRPKKKKKKRG